jgi:energy-coupling factor transporter ATP-binding protein EcfA2
MITKLTLRNFKSIGEQTYHFTKFDLLVGRNNCGKSTILQSLAIWQFCVDEFHRAKRSGSTGIQVVLPNFTALPVPQFNLLWKDRTDRRYPVKGGKKAQEYILIEIDVTWLTAHNEEQSFGVRLRYNSPQALYAIPAEGWAKFRELDKEKLLPVIAYVPPFSGLEPSEEWRDDGPLKKQVGKAQPGSVLRNLLQRVFTQSEKDGGERGKGVPVRLNWMEVSRVVKNWFSVELKKPKYEKGVDTEILCEYQQGDKSYDIIAGGSGFHQTLTLLAFLYGYRPTTILLDEPDAHLHVNLQREILDYFKAKSNAQNVQFLIATHAEEFANGVDASQIVSLLGQHPKRVESTPEVLRAMADVSNAELAELWASPIMLYVEGQSDERMLRAWAKTCGAEEHVAKVCFRVMGGGTKQLMKESADRHYDALRCIIPEVSRLMLFDYDEAATYHPEPGNPALFEWKRKNIENYLLVPDAWIRAALGQLGFEPGELFVAPIEGVIREFFVGENLTLPVGKAWRNLKARIFTDINGKKLLFENDESLFQLLRAQTPSIELIRETVAGNMSADEIHDDVHAFFEKLKGISESIASTH